MRIVWRSAKRPPVHGESLFLPDSGKTKGKKWKNTFLLHPCAYGMLACDRACSMLLKMHCTAAKSRPLPLHKIADQTRYHANPSQPAHLTVLGWRDPKHCVRNAYCKGSEAVCFPEAFLLFPPCQSRKNLESSDANPDLRPHFALFKLRSTVIAPSPAPLFSCLPFLWGRLRPCRA